MSFPTNAELLQYAQRLLHTTKHGVRRTLNISPLYSSAHTQCRRQHNAATQSQPKQPFNPLDIQQLIRNATQQHATQPSGINTTVKQHSQKQQHAGQQDTVVSPRPNIPTRIAEQSPVLQEANTQHYTPPVNSTVADGSTVNNTQSTTANTEPAQTVKPAAKPRIRPNLAAIQLTEAAANRIKYLLSTQQNAVGIRIGVRSRGCSGLSYTINYVHADQLDTVKRDDKVQQYGLTVYIETKSLFYIVGTTMDYVDTELASEFVFNNPKAKSQCGCGESFTV